MISNTRLQSTHSHKDGARLLDPYGPNNSKINYSLFLFGTRNQTLKWDAQQQQYSTLYYAWGSCIYLKFKFSKLRNDHAVAECSTVNSPQMMNIADMAIQVGGAREGQSFVLKI
jgi:hypothetical protein